MKDLLTIILAAGKGTRMKSDKPKVLHPVGGKPMLEHVVETAEAISSEIICVVGYQGKVVREKFKEQPIRFVKQKKQLGTGHAVIQARKYIDRHQGPVLILYGDTPLITKKTLEKMVDYHRTNDSALSVLTARIDNPEGYGRIIRDANEQIEKIVEEDDADAQEKEINEINTGVYCFNSELLLEALDKIDCDNAQGEYYLTDAVDFINQKSGKVIPVVVEDNEEIIGINTRKGLAEAEKIYRKWINNKHLKQGVTLIDPENTYIDAGVKIKKDTTIYPYTYLEGDCEIGENVTIGPNNRLINSKIGDQVELKANCIIRSSEVKKDCTIGPFAYIRPGSSLAQGVKIGDFVELKKAQVGEGTKIPHLSYVGDALIGNNTNVGAGTVFANYDGENKHQTKVGDSSFIGSNTTLVAPVNIEKGGKTGAGAVVTKDVPENTVVIGVPARIYKKED